MLTFMLGGIISKLALGPGVALEIKKKHLKRKFRIYNEKNRFKKTLFVKKRFLAYSTHNVPMGSLKKC